MNKSLSTKLRIYYFQTVMRDIHAAVMKSDFALNWSKTICIIEFHHKIKYHPPVLVANELFEVLHVITRYFMELVKLEHKSLCSAQSSYWIFQSITLIPSVLASIIHIHTTHLPLAFQYYTQHLLFSVNQEFRP